MTMVREMQEAIATIQRFVNEEEAPLGTNLALKGVADFLEGVLTLDSDRHGALGRRVEALLASEEPPEGLREALDAGAEYLSAGQLFAGANAAWAWYREQLLGPTPGSLATGGATGGRDGE